MSGGLDAASLRTLAAVYAAGVGGVFAGVGILYLAQRRMPERFRLFAEQGSRGALLATAAFFLLTLPVMAVMKDCALRYYADRATHLEILWRATHGMGLTSLMSESYHHGTHWFAAHFTPIVYVLVVPLFKLAPSGTTLALIQIAVLFSAVIPIYLEARDRLGAQAAAWIGGAYLMYPTVHYTALYGIAYLEFSIPAIAWSLRFLHGGRLRAFAASLIAVLAVREELGLVVFMLGLYAAWRGHRRVGGATALAGLAYTVIALKVVIPSFRDDSGLVFMRNYGTWGGSPAEIVLGLVAHPLEALRRLATLPRLGNLTMYLLPLGFLPLAAPELLLVAAPNVLSTFMSDSISNYSFTLYYLTPSIPIFFFAAILGVERCRKLTGAEPARPAMAVFACSMLCNVFFGASPVSLQFWLPDYKVGVFRTTNFYRSEYVPDAAARSSRKLAALVPAGAQVAAPQHLLPLLYRSRRIAVFPAVDPGIDHVLIDRSRGDVAGWADTYDDFRKRPEHYYAAIERSKDWRELASEGGVKLFSRKPR